MKAPRKLAVLASKNTVSNLIGSYLKVSKTLTPMNSRRFFLHSKLYKSHANSLSRSVRRLSPSRICWRSVATLCQFVHFKNERYSEGIELNLCGLWQ